MIVPSPLENITPADRKKAESIYVHRGTIRGWRVANPQPPLKVPRSRSLEFIHVEACVFQPREIGLDHERVEEISEDLNGGALDERVRVWWSGMRWTVIDGHHRHAAYTLPRKNSGETLKLSLSIGKCFDVNLCRHRHFLLPN
jgi:hypothetical protein